MTFAEIFKALGGNTAALIGDYGFIGAALIIVCMTVVQAVPTIKVNPWSWIGHRIGKAINGEVLAKVNDLEKQVKEVKQMQDDARMASEEKDAKTARVRILRFGDEVQNHKKHTKEHFDEILRDVNSYEAYCDAHPNFKNNQAKLTIENLRDVYRELQRNNEFL